MGLLTASLAVGEGELNITAGDSGVTISGDNNSGSVILSGTLTQIDNLLTGTGTGTIAYTNSSNTPSANTLLSVTVDDGGNTGSGGVLSDSASQTINIDAVNDTPVVTGPDDAYTVDEQDTLAIEGTGFTVSDVDAGNGILTASLAVGEGELNITAGDSGVTISGDNNSGSVILSGTLTQIDNLLTGTGTGTIAYTNSSNTPSADTLLSVTVDDGGNTGSGGVLSDSASQTINIDAVNDTPVVTGPDDAYTVDEQDTLAIEGTGFTVSDVDAGNGTTHSEPGSGRR